MKHEEKTVKRTFRVYGITDFKDGEKLDSTKLIEPENSLLKHDFECFDDALAELYSEGKIDYDYVILPIYRVLKKQTK